jgi:hypothetical protein
MKTPRGRPKQDIRKSKTLGVRFEESEKALIETASRKAGLKPSEWARQILLDEANKAIIV